VAVLAEIVGLILATNYFQECVPAIAMKLKNRVYHTMAPEPIPLLAPLVMLPLNSNTLTTGLTNAFVPNPVVRK